MDAWDIENSKLLQLIFCNEFLECVSLNDSRRSGYFDVFLQQSKRISALGQVIYAKLIHDIVSGGREYTFLDPAQSIYDDFCGFLINQGADIEFRDSFRMETALLVVAELDNLRSLRMLPVLLRFDADYSAVDYKGRGLLHLALKPARKHHNRYNRLHPRDLTDKLVCLLQAGCSIHAVDNYGRTPTDVARRWGRMEEWEAALEEVGKLECARSNCQCGIIVRLSPCLLFHYRVLALAVPAAIDSILTIAKDRTSRVQHWTFLGILFHWLRRLGSRR